MCKSTQEPIFLTVNGEGELAVISIDAFQRQEKMLALWKALVRVEEDQLAGRQGCSVDELDAELAQAIEGARHG